MKRQLLLIVLALVSFTAMADSTSTSTSTSTAGSTAGAFVPVNSGNQYSNSGNVTGSDLGRMVPNVMAPNLATTLTETCMGSTSFGGAGAGFGFSFGTTWRDTACVRRLDSRQLSAFGDLPTAREVMCDSDLVRAAAVRAGRACVADGGAPWGQPIAVVQEQVVPTPEAAAPVVTQQVKQ